MIATDCQLLLRACRQAPDDDTPRLILADAVQESGHELAAQYIRESIDTERTKSLRSARVKRRIRTMLGNAYVRWLCELWQISPDTDTDGTDRVLAGKNWDTLIWNYGDYARRRCNLVIHRGLPTVVTVTAPMLIERAAKLFLFPLTKCCINGRRPDRWDGLYMWTRVHMWPQKFSSWEDDDNPHQLPPMLFDLLPPDPQLSASGGPIFKGHYRSSSNAAFALDAAALAFGRQSVD